MSEYRDGEEDFRFDETQHDRDGGDTYDPAGVGRWGASKNKPTEKTQMTTTQPTAKKQLGPCDAVTPVYRASYLNVFEARAADPSKPDDKNYGVEMWFRVADTEESVKAGEKIVDLRALYAAAKAAIGEKWGADEAKWPKGLKIPFKKGETNTGKQGSIPGVIILRTARKEKFGKPVVVTQDPNVPVLDTKTVYSGCYMRGKIHFYAWEHPTGGKGVSATLDMLQIVRDGEPLGNRMEATDAFEALPVPAGQPAGAAPASGAVKAEAPAAASPFGELA